MRIFVLIGVLALLVLPFSYSRLDVDGGFAQGTGTTYYGLFYFRTVFESGPISIEDSDFFNPDWMNDNGVYDFYFGDFKLVGVLILVLLIVGLVLALTDTSSNRSTYILLVSGILLLILRYLHLGDNNLSFYESEVIQGENSTYLEIPLGFIFGTIFSVLDFKKGTK